MGIDLRITKDGRKVAIQTETKDKKSYWVRIPKKWWLESLKGLNAIERSILIDLRVYANPEGFCYPSLRRVSADLEISFNTTRKYLKILEKKGHIKIVITRRGNWKKWTYKMTQI